MLKMLKDPQATGLAPARAWRDRIPAAYRVACPNCRAQLEVGRTALGQDRKCPACQKLFGVPLAGDEAIPLSSATAASSGASTPEATDESPPTVLLVDDSPSIRRVGESILRRAGYEVLLAASGYEAIEIVRGTVPHLVVLDIHLADVSGYDLCAALRLFPALQMTPILLLTGNDGHYDANRGRAAGCDDYLAKPCDPAALVARVHMHLPRPC